MHSLADNPLGKRPMLRRPTKRHALPILQPTPADDRPQGETMIRSASRPLLIAGGALALVSALAAPAEAQPAQVPNFQSGPGGWTHPFAGPSLRCKVRPFPCARIRVIP